LQREYSMGTRDRARIVGRMAEVSDPRGALQVELHQLTLRYAHLRKRHPRPERALLSSLAQVDQQLPIVVVSEAERFVLIDGYKRVRALKRLARDTVRATCWQIAEAEALLLERSLRCGTEDALDQGWLLAELQERFLWSLEELARRFEHSKSWVSGRLALLQTLPAPIQEQVREGSLSAHAAMKYLVPLARTDAQAAQQLAAALRRLAPTTRQVGAVRRLAIRDATYPRAHRAQSADLSTSPRGADRDATLSDSTLSAGSGRARRHRTACTPCAARGTAATAAAERTARGEGSVRARERRPATTHPSCRTGERGMLDEATRTAILKLHEQGHGSRKIAQALAVARATVRQVIGSGSACVPPLVRAERAEPWREQTLQLYTRYEGHLGRVHEELTKCGAALSYPALTAFCRKHGIGTSPPMPAGRYVFPVAAFLTALASAERYRLFNLDRLEKMVLRQIADDYFVLVLEPDSSDE